jgi:hypothetical protein
MRKPLEFDDIYRMVEYSMATDKGFQFGSLHGPGWVPIVVGVVVLFVVWQIIGSFLKPSQ